MSGRTTTNENLTPSRQVRQTVFATLREAIFTGDKMKQEKKPQQPNPKNRPTHKTKEDFMRWWQKQDARKKEEVKNNKE